MKLLHAAEKLATISNPFGDSPHIVQAEEEGIIIGLSSIPLVNRGDAMIHIANFGSAKRVRRAIEVFDDIY